MQSTNEPGPVHAPTMPAGAGCVFRFRITHWLGENVVTHWQRMGEKQMSGYGFAHSNGVVSFPQCNSCRVAIYPTHRRLACPSLGEEDFPPAEHLDDPRQMGINRTEPADQYPTA
jgi:hypothetical protein